MADPSKPRIKPDPRLIRGVTIWRPSICAVKLTRLFMRAAMTVP